MGISTNMTIEKSHTTECDLCGHALLVDATVCPNCGMNLLLNKLIDKIPRAIPGPEPSAATTGVGTPEDDYADEAHQDELAPRLIPEQTNTSANRLDPEPDHGEIKQSQLEESLVRNAPAEELAPLVTGTVFTPPQDYASLLPTTSKADSLQRPRSHGFSRVWILSAILLVGLIFLFIEYLGKSNQLQAMSGDYWNPQNTVIAQEESLRRAESTISAQQNTIIAQQTRPANQIDVNMTLLFGPDDGILIHNNDGLIKTYWADQDSKNFILNVVLVNPYPSTFHSWDTCIRFRRNYTDEYRLTIFSTEQWALTSGLSTEPIAGGTLTNLRTGEGESNTVLLVVRDEIASLKVNDVLVPDMDVSAYQEAGDIGIAIGSRQGDEVNGKTTIFKEFTLWKIP
jgi:hypothetical protein